MATAEFVRYIFLALGGLGMFLYGMKMMTEGLEGLAGNKMRAVIERATSNRFFGVGVGAAATVVMQSSTATSIMVVGFINAGLMTLAQAVSIIMGAYVGKAVTIQIIAFRVDTVAPLFIFAGLVLFLFIKRQAVKKTGFIILGIGVLFFGLSVMGDALKEFSELPGFQSLLTAFSNPLLAILAGFIFTAIINSSTAAIGILIALLLRGVDLDFVTAAFLILGINMGTTVTALLASIAGNRESKRAALANLMLVSTGSIVVGLLITVFPGIPDWFQSVWQEGARKIAMFLTFANIITVLMALATAKYFTALMYKIIPKQKKVENEKSFVYIKSKDSHEPEIALFQAQAELSRMGQMVLDNLKLAIDVFFTGDREKAADVKEAESSIDFLNRQITSWLKNIHNLKTEIDMERLTTLLYIASDLERIGDHAENISEYEIHGKDSEARLPPQAMEELKAISGAVLDIFSLTVEAFIQRDESLVPQIMELEDKIDDMAKEFIENHIRRLKSENIDPRGGVAFLGLVTDLERCADHANNIANYFVGQTAWLESLK